MATLGEPLQHQVIDTQHDGMLIEEFTHGSMWFKAESMALWNWENPNNLILISACIGDGFGHVVRIYPDEQYYWIGYISPMYDRPGSLSLPPYVSAATALLNYVIPRYRSSCKKLRVKEVIALPNLAQVLNLNHMVKLGARGIAAKITYEHKNQGFEEVFFALKYVQPESGGQQNWGLAAIFSVRASTKNIDLWRSMSRGQDRNRESGWRSWTKVGIKIVQSIRPNPQWQMMFQQIAHQLYANQLNAAAMQQRTLQNMQDQEQRALSNYLDWSRQTQGALLDAKWAGDSSNPMKPIRDLVSQFGDLVLGRTAYEDPLSEYQNPHHDYTHSEYVYTDGQGNWQYTDDPMFDPNVGSDRTWKPAKKQ